MTIANKIEGLTNRFLDKILPMSVFDTKLKARLERLDEISTINHGGCAIVAYALVEHIKETYAGKKPVVVFLFSRHNLDSVNNVKNGVIDSCGHAVVRVRNKYYDSEGIHTLEEVQNRNRLYIKEELDQEFVLDCIKEGIWNKSFDRHLGVPKICKVLELNDMSLDRIAKGEEDE